MAAPATGRLYLAFNDGVSFQDNNGEWQVSITIRQPTPTLPLVTLYLGGSDPSQGINAATNLAFAKSQAPAWANKTIDDRIVPYPGVTSELRGAIVGKQLQAQHALAKIPSGASLIVVGYSAGSSAAVIFADLYLEAKQAGTVSANLIGLGILGSTLTGGTNGYNNGEGLRTIINGEPQWQGILKRVLASGTRVLVLNDKFETIAESTKPNWGSYQPQSPNYCYVRRFDRRHYVNPTLDEIGTNNDSNLATSVIDFLKGNTRCLPSH